MSAAALLALTTLIHSPSSIANTAPVDQADAQPVASVAARSSREAGKTKVAGDEIKPDCTFRGQKLYGKVQIVQSFADFKVKKVEHFADLKVQMVNSFPDACGKWQIVDSFADFKIQFVESFPDFEISQVEHFPGLP